MSANNCFPRSLLPLSDRAVITIGFRFFLENLSLQDRFCPLRIKRVVRSTRILDIFKVNRSVDEEINKGNGNARGGRKANVVDARL